MEPLVKILILLMIVCCLIFILKEIGAYIAIAGVIAVVIYGIVIAIRWLIAALPSIGNGINYVPNAVLGYAGTGIVIPWWQGVIALGFAFVVTLPLVFAMRCSCSDFRE